MKITESKTDLFQCKFNKKSITYDEKEIFINGTKITPNKIIKHLGVIFEPNLKFKKTKEKIITKIKDNSNLIRCNYLQPKNVNRIVEAFLHSMHVYFDLIGIIDEKMIKEINVEISKYVKKNIYLSKRVSKNFIFNEPGKGGLSIVPIQVHFDVNFMTHTFRQLNSEINMLKKISRENLKETKTSNEENRYKGDKWERFLNTLKYYNLKIVKDPDNKEKVMITDEEEVPVLFNEIEDNESINNIVKLKYYRELKGNKDDAITKYDVHEISHQYWDNNYLKSQEKKIMMQYNSGSLYNKEWMHPARCKFCRTNESIKHATWECEKIDTQLKEAVKKLIAEILGNLIFLKRILIK
jgi:hypothetical protein